LTDLELPWTATVRVRTSDPGTARMLERALRPEAERELPRARAELRSVDDTTVELSVATRDSGAMRAALNTYLGWIHLAVTTLATASAESPFRPS
jgi:tRNA threonylcarbamoyladenosine modification (KEOPS) complex  Pcc1 subunit